MYEVIGDHEVFMGFLGGKQNLSMLRGYESVLDDIQKRKATED